MLKSILLSFLIAFETTEGFAAAKQAPQDPIAISQTDMNRLIQETKESVQKSSSNDPEVMKNFDEIINAWKTYYLEEKREASQLQVLLEAFTFSAMKHQEKAKNRNTSSSILHTLRTVQILWNEGKVREVHPQIVALLHNILEATPNTPEEIEEIFGPSITRLTEEYEDTALEDKHAEEKEHALDLLSKASLEVKLVKLADRIDYVRSNANNNSLAWQNSRLQKFTWDMQLVHALKGTNPALELILEEAYIVQLDSKPSN
jgi:(p)ppGpp synthase/HD superfamily hydrolase